MEILKLDSALEILYLNKDKAALSIKDIQKKMPFKLIEEEVSMVLDKFQGDHLVSWKKQPVNGYLITYEGIEFFQRGGYLRDRVRLFFKKLFKMSLVLIGVISTIVGIIIGLRELL